MTIRYKLMLAFGLLVGVVLLVISLAIYLLSEADSRFDNYVNGINARTLMADRVRAAVDMRAIAARNLVLVTSPEDLTLEKQVVERAHKTATDSLRTLTEMARAPGASEDTRKLIGDIAAVETLYAPVALNIVDLALRGQVQEAVIKMNQECRPLLARLIKAAEAYAQLNATSAAQQVADARTSYEHQSALLIAACVAAIALAVAAGFLIERSLRRDLGAEPADMRRMVSTVAAGDLSVPLVVRAGDEYSVLATIAQMQISLQRIVSTVREEAREVSVSSEQIAGGSSELATRTESQASSLEQTAAAMEELGATVRKNADNAQRADQLAQNARSVAVQGGEVVGRAVQTMQGINESSRRISEIIGVIDSIAFQTNILALNAAVEAARAGEQGRGFAVVASEVRNLAGRSAAAAKEIKALITNSVTQVTQGAELVETAGQTMERVIAGIRQVSELVEQIAGASKEQSLGVVQVGEAVTLMDRATQDNAAMVEEMSTSARGLHEKSQTLVHTVANFRLPGDLQARATQPLLPASATLKPALKRLAA